MGNSKRLLLAIARMTFLTSREMILLADMIEAPQELTFFEKRDLEIMCGRRLSNLSWNPQRFLIQAEEDERAIEAIPSIQLVPYWSRHYPPLLREIYNPPFLLFIRGGIPDPNRPCLAMVGTRYPDQDALLKAFKAGSQMALAGVWVVSGLALGIDGAAHEGVISVQGKTAAVLAGGIDQITPREHRALAAEIIEHGGCLISEFPPGVRPAKYSFPKRNRIISGICRGTLVVQAPLRSGALITADYALDQGRDLYVFSGFDQKKQAEGNEKLARMGAPVIDGAEDILKDWKISDRDVALNQLAYCNSENPAEWMSMMMEEELSGQAFLYKGEYFRRSHYYG